MGNLSGAILAGGKNKRMEGADKSFIDIQGIPIIQRAVNILKEMFEEIIIVTNSPRDFEPYKKECHIVSDIIKDVGPLGGIHSALSHTTKDAVFFVACDMPFLHNGVIHEILRYFNKVQCDALVPRLEKRIEPLHSIFRKGLKNDIRMFVEKKAGYSVRSFLETVKVGYWDVEDTLFYRNVFRNLNTPEDVREAI